MFYSSNNTVVSPENGGIGLEGCYARLLNYSHVQYNYCTQYEKGAQLRNERNEKRGRKRAKKEEKKREGRVSLSAATVRLGRTSVRKMPFPKWPFRKKLGEIGRSVGRAETVLTVRTTTQSRRNGPNGNIRNYLYVIIVKAMYTGCYSCLCFCRCLPQAMTLRALCTSLAT